MKELVRLVALVEILAAEELGKEKATWSDVEDLYASGKSVFFNELIDGIKGKLEKR